MYRILAVEDEPDIQEILKNYLTDQGYEIRLTMRAEQGGAFSLAGSTK